MNLIDLLTGFKKWWLNSTEARLDNPENQNWLYKSLGVTDELTLENQQKFFDRTDLNKEYVKRYKENSRRPYSHIETEITQIYSFQKSFILRNKSRLSSYRDDISQKTLHQLSTLNICIANHNSNVKLAELT